MFLGDFARLSANPQDGTIYLRAERSGGGDGRVYTITYRATDENGNVGFGSAEVLVPHSKGKKATKPYS